jgi:RNA polymerase sigma factor (sigma-70 family)
MSAKQEELVIEHTDDAAQLAKWMNRSYPALEEKELRGTAHLALVEAAMRFDRRRKTSFWSFAQDRIVGALRDDKRAHRRAMGLAPRGSHGDVDPDVLPTYGRPKELEDYVDPATSMGTRFGRAQQVAAVREIWDELTADEQQIAQLRLIDELPERECAEKLGVGKSTVERRELRLRKLLLPILAQRLGRKKDEKA